MESTLPEPEVVRAADPAWTWRFHSEDDLRRALEEYAEPFFQGEPPDGGDPDPTMRDRSYRLYAKNRAIDRGMAYIGAASPYAWTLINTHFRGGQCARRRGWIATAAVLNRKFDAGFYVPKCPGPVRCRVAGDDRMDRPLCRMGKACEKAHEHFECQLELAVAGLFWAIKRPERASNLTPEMGHQYP